MNYSDVIEYLKQNSDPSTAEFSSKLTPGAGFVYGVKLPLLRLLAKKLAYENWRNSLSMLLDNSQEEILLQGFIIGVISEKIGRKSAKNYTPSLTEVFNLVAGYVEKINNWALCDSFCSSLKFIKNYKVETYLFLNQFLYSQKECQVRFALVVFLMYYTDEEDVKKILPQLEKLCLTGYYAQMATAWLLQVYFVKQRNLTLRYLESFPLDNKILVKTIGKICDSFRVDLSDKKFLREKIAQF